MERRLAAILAADVVGYTRLMEADEAGTLEAIKALRSDLIDPLIAEHRGRIVKLMGDGALVEFASAVDAVACAIDIQRDLTEQNANESQDRRIELRIGINLGDVIVEGEDIYGEGVNVASRLEGIAEPGGVSISEKVYQEVEKKLDLEFAYLGEFQVKNIEKPVRTYAAVLGGKRPVAPKASKWRLMTQGQLFAATVIAIALIGSGIVAWLKPWAPDVEPASIERMAFPLPDKPSIAVLPFENLSGDPQQDHLSDGLSEDIIAALSRLPDLFVIARNSSFTYKGNPVKVQQVAEELGVRYVLEGSVQRSSDRLRVTAQLIDALTGHHLWAERYDRVVTELFALKDEITLNILTGLQVQLLEGQLARLTRRDTENLEAWLLLKEGVGYAFRFTKEDNIIAREILEKAVNLDPGFVAAHVLLGWRHLQDARNKWSKSPEQSLEKAVEFAEKAMALDSSNSQVYALLLGIHLFKREHDAAIAAGKKGLALDPNDSGTAGLLALAYQKALQPEESIRLFKTAMRLSPYYPDWILENLGESYLIAQQYEDAIAAYQNVLERRSVGNIAAEAHLGLALSYDALGREDEARVEIAKVIEVTPQWTISFLRGWQQYKDQAYLERYLAKLRRLGLPEE